MHPDAINSLINANHGAPFDILGPHITDGDHLSIRAIRPNAQAMAVVTGSGRRYEMQRLRDEGFYEITIPAKHLKEGYLFESTKHNGYVEVFEDPYRFPTVISDFDIYLFNQGTHLYAYDKFGARPMTLEGVEGVYFAVWSPNAYRVGIVGNFNDWDVRVHPMRYRDGSGIWELFIPGLKLDEVYKYDIKSRVGGYHVEKSDPYAFGSEMRPHTASVVVDLDAYQWNDDEWMERRTVQNPLEKPMSIYEVHLGSWKRHDDHTWLTYRELAHELVAYAKEMNYTHLELMPVAEHPLDASWGYQITGYYAPTRRYGTPHDFMYFVDHCHQNGIGVILDWVPAHFPKDAHGLSFFDGTHLYEHADPRQGEQPDWGTYVFNFGRHEVSNFLLSNALFWLKRYHIDGLRVDAVSSMLYLDFSRQGRGWIPNRYGSNENLEAIDFIKRLNEITHQECPGTVMIAEESTAWAMVSRPTYIGGLGFTLKWNMGWMHDTLDYVSKDPIHRRYQHHLITFSLFYAFSENFILSLSHDEVVHGKGSLIGKVAGDWWQKFATLRVLYGYQMTHPGKKLLFMGQEFGQWREWHEDRELDWKLLTWPTHGKLKMFVSDLNRLYQHEPALYEQDFNPAGYHWIEPNDSEQSVFSYIRIAKNSSDFVVVVCNFTPVPRYNYRIGVPDLGYYEEILNSDSERYGGGNIGNMGGLEAEAMTYHGLPFSLSLTIPPLSILLLKCANKPAQ